MNCDEVDTTILIVFHFELSFRSLYIDNSRLFYSIFSNSASCLQIQFFQMQQ